MTFLRCNAEFWQLIADFHLGNIPNQHNSIGIAANNSKPDILEIVCVKVSLDEILIVVFK